MSDSRTESYFFIIAIILVGVLTAFIFLPELSVIVLGISLAVLFYPLYKKLCGVCRGRDGIAAALIVLIAIAIILIPLMFFGLEIFLEAQGLYTRLASGGGLSVANWIRPSLARYFSSVNINIGAYAQQFLGLVISNLGSIFSGVLGAGGTFFLSFFALYYFLKDGEKVHAVVARWIPLPTEYTKEIFAKLHMMVESVVRGSLLVSALYGIFVGLGFFIFGVPSAILWGGVTAIASFIPVFGVYLIVVPGIIFLAVAGHGIAAIGLAAWVLVMSACIENYLRPRLIGRAAKIHPLLMLFAVLGGLSFFGPIGLLLGPLALSLLLTLLEIYPLLALDALNKK